MSSPASPSPSSPLSEVSSSISSPESTSPTPIPTTGARSNERRESVFFYQLYRGWKDATNISHAIQIFARSPKLQKIFVSCFLLNGLIFIGSILILDYMIYPLFRYGIQQTSSITSFSSSSSSSSHHHHHHHHSSSIIPFIQLVYASVKNIFWIWPMYTISLILCTIWYNEISELVYKYLESKRKSLPMQQQQQQQQQQKMSPRRIPSTKVASLRHHHHYHHYATGTTTTTTTSIDHDISSLRTNLVDKITDGIYRSVLLLFFLMQVSLLSMLPSYLGSIIPFCMTCWLYAFYAFDYSWSYKTNYNTERKLHYFERHWLYMMGFGAPNALASYFFPFFINAGVWAMIFPLFIVLAMLANPPSLPSPRSNHSILDRIALKPLPIFYCAQKCMNYIVLGIGGRLC